MKHHREAYLCNIVLWSFIYIKKYGQFITHFYKRLGKAWKGKLSVILSLYSKFDTELSVSGMNRSSLIQFLFIFDGHLNPNIIGRKFWLLRCLCLLFCIRIWQTVSSISNFNITVTVNRGIMETELPVNVTPRYHIARPIWLGIVRISLIELEVLLNHPLGGVY